MDLSQISNFYSEISYFNFICNKNIRAGIMADSLGSVVLKKNNKPKATNCFKKSERGKLGPPAFKFQYRGTVNE